MKNIAVLTVLVIIFSAYSYAQENESNYCFSFGPQFGFVYGQAFEYVYPVPGETKGELLSELIWDMKPVFYYGIQAEFSRADMMSGFGFFSSLSFKAGIPTDSGNMEDRDWRSIENGDLTNFSQHTNRTSEFYWLDIAVGFSLPVKTYFYFKPFISGSWMRSAFTGKDGYYKYARKKMLNSGLYHPIDDDPDKGSFSGNVIDYTQDWFLVAAGFSAGTNILYPFSFELSFQLSPLTYCASTDNHILADNVYRDSTGWGLFVEPSFKMSFIVKPVEFSFRLSYRHIGKTEGESYANMNNTGYSLNTSKAGAGFSMWDSRFIVNIRL